MRFPGASVLKITSNASMLKPLALVFLFVLPSIAQHPPKAVLWSSPSDIASRNLKYGIGGEADAPTGSMHFNKEDLHGNSPKFDVRDDVGRKWKVKLGKEAQSETAATRLLWAVGYYTDEDYFLPSVQVEGLPHLKRGSQFEQGEQVKAARLELGGKGEKSEGEWHWKKNPFTGTRELNGLRVMMCLINNWDLKDENNSIHRDKNGVEEYLIGDLGATFGKAGRSWTSNMSKNDPQDYRHAKFITKKTDTYVDFNIAQHPPLLYTLNIVKPWRYWQFSRLRWIGKRIPREDVRWIAKLLAQLSDRQLQDAFTSSGYTPEETASLVDTLKTRIALLQDL